MTKATSLNTSHPVNHMKWIDIGLIKTTDCDKNLEYGPVMDDLRESITERGFYKAITVRVAGDNYEIVNGYHRYLVGKEMGMPELPVIMVGHTRDYSRVVDQFEDKEWLSARE